MFSTTGCHLSLCNTWQHTATSGQFIFTTDNSQSHVLVGGYCCEFGIHPLVRVSAKWFCNDAHRRLRSTHRAASFHIMTSSFRTYRAASFHPMTSSFHTYRAASFHPMTPSSKWHSTSIWQKSARNSCRMASSLPSFSSIVVFDKIKRTCQRKIRALVWIYNI